MRKIFIFLMILLILPFWVSGRTITRDGVTITINKTDEFQESIAKCIIKASPDIVWSVISDFDNHEKFMPNVTKSRIISVNGNTWTVEKEINILFKRVPMILFSTETSPGRILKWIQKKGPFEVNKGQWVIEPVANGDSLVTYSAKIQPSFYVPGWVQRRLTEGSIPKLFKAIEKEVFKRINKTNR